MRYCDRHDRMFDEYSPCPECERNKRRRGAVRAYEEGTMICECGHFEEHHIAHPSGRWPCKHFGCGCADFEREAVRGAAALLGRRGGLKGGRATGASKRRGDSAYYRALQAKRPRTYAATLNGKTTRVTIPED